MRSRVSKTEFNALSVRLELQADCCWAVGDKAQSARFWKTAMWKRP
jgi:predicted metalloprotease